jgi:hypothetical protein
MGYIHKSRPRADGLNQTSNVVSTVRNLLTLFAVSVAINFVWEMAQMPLYEDMPFDALSSWWLCFRASIGDGVIVLTIWAIGAAVYNQSDWFRPLHLGNITVLLMSGAAIAVGIEIHAIGTGRWAYSALMPILPVANVGLSPLVQLLLLPFISMKLAVKKPQY